MFSQRVCCQIVYCLGNAMILQDKKFLQVMCESVRKRFLLYNVFGETIQDISVHRERNDIDGLASCPANAIDAGNFDVSRNDIEQDHD